MQKICYTIRPYRYSGLWYFDSPEVGLMCEGLTDGAPEVLLRACELAGINSNFIVGFTDTKFGMHCLDFVTPLWSGSQYRWADQNMVCWFCPALLKFFPEPPKQIYFSVFSNLECARRVPMKGTIIGKSGPWESNPSFYQQGSVQPSTPSQRQPRGSCGDRTHLGRLTVFCNRQTCQGANTFFIHQWNRRDSNPTCQ